MSPKLKQILKLMGKAVLVEDDEPKYVVMSVDEYLKISGQNIKTDSSDTVSPDYTQKQSQGVPQQTPQASGADNAQYPIDLSEIDMSDTDNLKPQEASSHISLDDLPL